MANKIRHIAEYLLIALVSVAWALLVASAFPYIFANFVFWLRSMPAQDIVLVAIDDKTLNAEEFKLQWDLTRDDYADILRKILYGNPKWILTDIVFYQNSQNPVADEQLRTLLIENPHIVVGAEVNENKKLTPLLFMERYPNYDSFGYVNTLSYNTLSLFGSQSPYKNFVPLYFKWQDVALPLSFKLYNVINDNNSYQVTGDQIIFNKQIAPLYKGDFSINFSTDYQDLLQNNQVVSFIDIQKGNVDLNVFKDKIVFLGATAHVLHDEFYTPFNRNEMMPWVLIHINAYKTLESQSYVYYPTILIYSVFLGIAALIFVYFLTRLKSFLVWSALSIAALTLMIVVAVGLFVVFGIYIEIFPLLIVFVICAAAIFLLRFLQEKRSKDVIKGMFSKYVSADVVDNILKSWIEDLNLWWQRKNVSVFFSDLVWFTDLSEWLEPERLGLIINTYFDEMSAIILKNKWTIDKFIGDAIMAFWNAPLDIESHHYYACKTALEQMQALDWVRKMVYQLGSETDIWVRMWINCWDVVVGNFGSQNRFDYTILWDAVNLASRLEWINKQYGTNIIISEDMYENISQSDFVTRKLDKITVKWKTKPKVIYELVWFAKDFADEEKLHTISIYQQWLELYMEGYFEEALRLFVSIEHDYPAQRMVERIEILRKSRIDRDSWDGVFRYNTK